MKGSVVEADAEMSDVAIEAARQIVPQIRYLEIAAHDVEHVVGQVERQCLCCRSVHGSKNGTKQSQPRLSSSCRLERAVSPKHEDGSIGQ